MSSMDFPKVTRVEIIGPITREVVRYASEAGVTIFVQDDERTIKIFVGKKETWEGENQS